MSDEKSPRPANWKIAIAAALGVAITSAGIAINLEFNAEINVTPPDAREGWAGPEAVKMAKPVVMGMPDFKIKGAAGDNERKNVRLWTFAKAVNDGEHLKNIPQQVGDCVSWGVRNAVDYLACVQIARGPPASFKPSYAPYFYGISRVQVGGGRLRGDGSVGAWAAEGVRLYGVLDASFNGVPKYSGRVAREWGRKGPPDKFIKEARQFPVKTVAPVRTADQVRDSVCNGYPVTIASDWGGRHDQNLSRKHNRIVFRRSGRWMHQMCVIAYDGQTASEPLFYIINSWGPNAHPQPIDDSPPGGFWVRKQDIEYIVDQRDSFAFSQFVGFPPQELDWRIIGEQNAQVDRIDRGPDRGRRLGRVPRRRVELVDHRTEQAG